MKIVFASSNMHKFRELKSMLKELGSSWDLFSLRDFPDYKPPEETGTTFEANATLKATTAAKALNELVLADDSGLVVPALEGRPGIRSARYAGGEATDRDNRLKLLEEMKELEGEARNAYFVCAMAVATPEGLEHCVSARCEGSILNQERGGQGFGYDPVFLRHDYNKTFAELDDAVKNKVSHRRRALEKILLHALSH